MARDNAQTVYGLSIRMVASPKNPSATGTNARGSRTAEVTPDGEALVFSSTQDLTGYDIASHEPAIGTSGQCGNEIFVFNAHSAQLTCVSCDPMNRPADPDALRGGYTTYLPVSSSYTFMHRWTNTSGTEVFFDSSQPLSEEDSNGTQDVYEWTAQGTPSCPVSTSVYGGCVFLLTSGESESFSFLVDVDESGSNVFVVHRGPMYGVGPAGTKSFLYDVRVGGGFPQTTVGCTGPATCPAAPGPAPAMSVPASMTFSGSDNFEPQPPLKKSAAQIKAAKLHKALKACKKAHRKSRKKRLACERAARKKYAPKPQIKSKPKPRKKGR